MQLLHAGGGSCTATVASHNSTGGSGGSSRIAGRHIAGGRRNDRASSSAAANVVAAAAAAAASSSSSSNGAGNGMSPPPPPPPPPPPRLLDNATGPQLLAQIDTFLFDQDGVLWTGERLIPGAIEAVNELRGTHRRRVLFLTNNSSKSRAEYAAKLAALGVTGVAAGDVVASSFTAAAYLRDELRFGRTPVTRGRRVLVLGSQGLIDEVAAVVPGGRAAVVDGRTLDALPVFDTHERMLRELAPDASIGAVVAGFDPTFNYSKLFYVSACVREHGAALLATNLDDADAIGGGRMMPGTGCIARALSVACGVEAVDCGKGGAWLLPWLAKTYGLADARRTAMVGDRLDTDVALGQQGGFVTVLPTTGVTTLADALAAGRRAPDCVVPSVAALVGRCTLPPLVAPLEVVAAGGGGGGGGGGEGGLLLG